MLYRLFRALAAIGAACSDQRARRNALMLLSVR
jgi:hypothetical protein